MTITDSSSPLDLAYAEQSIADFTSGGLTTLANCVSEVESKLHRGTLTTSTVPTLAQVQGWLRRAKMELAEAKGFTFNRKYATCSTTAGTYRYALPEDYNGGLTRIRDTTNDAWIRIWQSNWYDRKYPDPSAESNDKIAVACVKNMELWFAPPPAGTYTLELEYDRSGAETTADDFAWLPEIERYRCCDFALAEAFEALHDGQRANGYREKWSYGLRKAIHADGKRKWKDMHFQAISTFQARTLSRYQQLDD